MTERRKFLRFSTNVGMEYRVHYEKEMSGLSCIKDLGRDGVRISIPKRFQRGTMLNAKFELPGDSRPIFFTGEIVWTNQPEGQGDIGYVSGVKFFKIDGFDRVRLLDYAYGEWLKSSKSF